MIRPDHNKTQGVCVALHQARCYATKHKDRFGSYPCVPLHCVLMSGHEKSQYFFLYASLTQRNACALVEPLYNGQVGAGAFVCYLEVSFIGRFHHSLGVAYCYNQ